MKPPVVFHIGFHKTASTFIQKGLFEAYPDCFYRVRQRAIFDHLIFPSDLLWDQGKASQFIERERAAAAGRIVVFSNERLSGGPHFGGHDSLAILKRIRELDEEANILVVVREQAAMIRSLYAQFVRAFGMCSLREYVESGYSPHAKELFDPTFLEYHRIVKEYMESFGADSVHVLPFEALVRNKEDFRCRVLDACAVPKSKWQSLGWALPKKENARSSALQVALLRRLNPLIRASIPHVGATYYSPITSLMARAVVKVAGSSLFAPLDRRLERRQGEYIHQFVADRYAESNASLQDLTGLDLGGLGYRVAGH